MQRHAGEEGLKIGHGHTAAFASREKQWNCIDQTVVVVLLMLLIRSEKYSCSN